MTAHKSTQETKRTATPPKMLGTDELGGRVRVAFFAFTVPTATVAADETVDLFTLPKGARLLGGQIAAEAMSTGGAAASIQIGVSGTPAKYLGTTSIDAAAISDFANTVALSYGELLSAETTIIATCKTEAWAATKILKGHVLYVLD